ncbi:MAG: GNAT family N-acetyltransferase [Candidatus Pacearchaeota archaeon]
MIQQLKLDNKNIENIIELHKKSIFEIWDKVNRKYSIEGIKKFIITVFEKGEVYGYFDKEMLSGVIGIEPKQKEIEISFLLVDPQFQRKGIGKKLMDFVEYKSKNIDKICLEVLIKNKAVNFYKKIGYEIIKEKNDKYVMEKKLK